LITPFIVTYTRYALVGLALLGSVDSRAQNTVQTKTANPSTQTAWNSAVGRLLVYGQRCQLVLVRLGEQHEARTAVTNRHCIEPLLPLSDENTYEINSLQGHFYNRQKVVYRKLTIREYGPDILGGDWAIVTLDEPIPLTTMHSFAITQPPSKQFAHERIARHYPLSGMEAAPAGSCRFDALLQATKGDVVRVAACPLKEGDSGSAYVGAAATDGFPVLMGIVKSKHTKNAETGYYIPLSTFFQPLMRALKAQDQ
jgi:hypothetical protein